MMTGVAIAATLALLFGFFLGRWKWTFALAGLLATLPLAAPEFLARPHILVLPICVLFTAEIIRAREQARLPRWWTLPLMVVWANMHASYPLGLVLEGLLAAEAVTEASRTRRAGTALRWGAFLAGSLVATCVSPYGYRTFVLALTVSQTAETTGYVAEWQPLGFDTQGIVAAAAVIFCIGLLQRHWRANLFRTAAVLLLASMTLAHARFALLLGLLMPTLVASPLAAAFAELRVQPFRLPRPAGLIGAALVCLLAVCTLARPVPNPDVTPAAALRFASGKGLTGPVYNDYDYGGFLILSGVKTFIDGRNDQLFLGGFTHQLSAALADPGTKPMAAILDKYGITWALVRQASPDATHLRRMDGWSEMFDDGDAAVFARACASSPCRDPRMATGT